MMRPLRRGASPEDEATPVVLPHVVIRACATGELTVTTDGQLVEPPPTGAWTRSRFGELLDLVTLDRTVAVRIEVHESDGSTFTDLIHTHRRTPAPAEEPPHPNGKHSARRRAEPVEVTGDGFLPGEQVLVAFVTTTTTATHSGQATTSIKPTQTRSGDVVLIGQNSGTVCIRRLS
ncbi:hypothetical protein GCM10009788_24120 [Nocardioides humi]|uniref:Uncharacterized protein n=1 Tax=Nocardioides humi TaxID=449461 RepID=A0ABN2AIR5_9ACTN